MSAIVAAIRRAADRENLSCEEAQHAMAEIMAGEATPAQIAALVAALRVKGETTAEIVGFARAMRNCAVNIQAPASAIDTCGTGGDSQGTFNISTAAALVAAGAGAKVAKHGNRAVSSSSGSADVLQALGVNIEADIATMEKCLREAGIAFLFAPRFHGAMRHAAPVRREIGIRTIFNLLGPLTNPAGASRQVVGVPSKTLTTIMAQALSALGAERALVVHGSDGMDEISIAAETIAVELREGEIKEYAIKPEDFHLSRAGLDGLRARNAQESAAIIKEILAGKKGTPRDAVLLNAGAAIYIAGLAPDLATAIAAAAAAIDTGRAAAVLEKLIALSQA